MEFVVVHLTYDLRSIISAWTCVLLLPPMVGCQLVPQRTVWREAYVAAPQWLASPLDPVTRAEAQLDLAKTAYAGAVVMERHGDARCVDRYYEAAARTWSMAVGGAGEDGLEIHPTQYGGGQDGLEIHPTEQGDRNEGGLGFLARREARDLHYSALVKTLTAAQEFGRWHPQTGLAAQNANGAVPVPVRYRGFVWQPEDFHQLIPVGPYSSTNLANFYGNGGAGAPLVVTRSRPPGQAFVRPQATFAATVVLKPADATCGNPSATVTGYAGLPPLVIELSDPLRRQTTRIGNREVPLASDLTAPLAFQLGTTRRTWWTDFVRSDTPTGNLGLYMLEPYQRGKIPVIFIHGLLSDPFTWADMVNELRSRPEISQRYQLWAFEYPTGQPFLASAARLRSELLCLRQTVDPYGSDAALSRIVMVGHSMGGLVAKLQVTFSGDVLWRTVANQPLEAIRAPDATRARLARNFFFGPSPDVSRVVFIGTPHHGSTDAQRAVGRLISSLVEPSPDEEALHDQLMRDNPGMFSAELADRIPTSVDLLEPTSPLLEGIFLLPVRPDVCLHSIIGNGRWSITSGPGDGVVPVSSAEYPNVASEGFVPAIHTLLTSDPDVIDEVVEILRLHAASGGR